MRSWPTSKDPDAASSCTLALAALALLGCASNGSPSATGRELAAANFSVCAGSPAVHYVAGMSVASASGAYRAALESAITTATGAGPIQIAAIGYDAFAVSVTAVGDGGADAGIPDGLTMTATSLPWMPVHMHGASTLPTVSTQGNGTFNVADIDFFMGGYWQLPLNLIPASGATDSVVFLICIPDN